VLATFVAGEFLSGSFVDRLFVVWLSADAALLAIAWLLQARLRRFVDGNVGHQLRLALFVNGGRTPLPYELPLRFPCTIPDAIQTVEPDARLFLTALSQVPHMTYISRTQFDYNPLRLSWLRIDKTSGGGIVHAMLPGDLILYHHRASLIGYLIRRVTRSYWEHSATYLGDGEVLDVAPGGVRSVALGPWLHDPRIELAILRPVGVNQETVAFGRRAVGSGYNYLGVVDMLWRIMAGQTGLGGLSLLRVIGYSTTVAVLLATLVGSGRHRIEVLVVCLMSMFAIGSMYHELAYEPGFEKFFAPRSDPNEEP
jgi:hypothetical protein